MLLSEDVAEDKENRKEVVPSILKLYVGKVGIMIDTSSYDQHRASEGKGRVASTCSPCQEVFDYS